MTRSRHKGQKGATLVEGAIVLPILIFTIVAILELGVAFKQFLTTDFAAKEGARVGALAGNDLDADCFIVQSIVAGYTGSDFENLDSITISKISGSGSVLLSNIWTFPNDPADDPNDCDDWTKSNPYPWPPQDRDVTVGGGSDLDILGVTVDTKHNWITNIPPWRGTMDIARTAIQRLEPEAFA